jgi:hypothetical protein
MDLPFTPEEKQQFLRRNYVVPLERHVDLFRNATQGVPDVSPQEHNQFLQRVENILQFEGRTDVQNIIIKNATKDFSGIPEGTIWNVYVPALREEYARGQGGRHEIADKEKYMFDRYIEEAHRQHPEIKIEPFQRPPHKAMQEFIQKHYPNGAPAAEGLYMEEYGVAASDRGKASKDMLATDYLVDCEAVVLTARKKDDPEKRMAVLAHMDVTTDVPKAVHKILGEIPPGYDVYATILASGLWSNPILRRRP